MIGIIDYGMGNLRSVQKAFERLGHAATILDHPNQLAACPALILPGVGAFRDAIAELQKRDFVTAIKDYAASGRPLLGICLGLQLLFDRSFEDGEYAGLGLLAGDIVRFVPEPELKIPHMGWNALQIEQSHPLLASLSDGDYVYFVHSYFVRPAEASVIIATTQHGTQRFPAVVGRANVMAAQFHPEKSQHVGLTILNNFANLCAVSAG